MGKAKAVTADLMKERKDTLKVKEMSEKNLDKKQTELDIFKTTILYFTLLLICDYLINLSFLN